MDGHPPGGTTRPVVPALSLELPQKGASERTFDLDNGSLYAMTSRGSGGERGVLPQQHEVLAAQVSSLVLVGDIKMDRSLHRAALARACDLLCQQAALPAVPPLDVEACVRFDTQVPDDLLSPLNKRLIGFFFHKLVARGLVEVTKGMTKPGEGVKKPGQGVTKPAQKVPNDVL